MSAEALTQDGAVALAAPQPMPSTADRLGAMDAAGVDVQVLSVSAPNVFRLPVSLRVPLARDLNDEFSSLAAAAGSRLRFFTSLPLPDVERSLEEADRALRSPYAVGLTVCTTIDRRTLDDPLFSPLWEELSRREAVVFVHPTTACCTDGLREYALSLALDYLAESTNAIGRLVYSGSFDRYPGIRWVFTHLGGTVPFLIHRFDNYAQQFPEAGRNITRRPSEILRGVTFDTVTTHPAALRCALETFGVEQFVFGTDCPHVPGGLQAFVDTLDAAGLPAHDRARVGRANAESLLGLATASRRR